MVFVSSRIKVDKIQNTVISTEAPSYPTIGQLWNDTSLTPPVLKVWTGSEWEAVNMSVKQLDPVAFEEINKIINDTIDDVNASRNEIDTALSQAQEAINKANIANESVEKVTADVSEAKKNAQEAIDKADLNDSKITEIKTQQSEDGQKITELKTNFNGISQTVSDLSTKQESDRVQLVGMIQDKVSNAEFESSQTMLADRISQVVSSTDGRFNSIQSTIDKTTQTIKDVDGRVASNTLAINGANTSIKDLETKQESDRTQLAGQISESVKTQEATNQRVTTAEQNISALTTSDGNQNKRLDTAEESIQTISKQTSDNTEIINETKKTAESNSQKIVDTSGKVSTIEQTIDKQSQTIADNTGRINQAVQDIDSANRTISNIDGRVSQVEQKADGISTTVSNVQNDISDLKSQSNLWPCPTFENDKLSDYTTIADNNNLVHIVTNGVTKFVSGTSQPYGKERPITNASSKALRLEGRTDGNRDCFLKNDYIINVSDNDVFDISFDYYKQSSNGATCCVGFKAMNSSGGVVSWINVSAKTDNGTKWWHKDGQLTIEAGKGIVQLLPYAAFNKTGSTSDYCYMDNIVIKRRDSKQVSTDSQVSSQQTQLNQKPDRTEIIASSNDNPKAYFQLGTFSSGPNAGRGYVSVGADYGFFLKTNTFIEDGFVLSAKHISAGQLVANTPAWITSSTDNWEVDKNSYVTKYDLDKSNIFLGPTGMTNEAFTAMSLENGGIQFLYDNNGNTRAGFKTVGYMFPYIASSSTPEIQILGASAKYGLSIIGDDTTPYGRLSSDKSRVYIGRDALADDGTAAIASNTVYTWRLQTPKDGDDIGISVDDKLLIEEGLWSKWNNNGKQTHIDFPNKNGGDVIEFHTSEGDGAFNSGYKAYFQMVNGNWESGGVDAQHHAIVVGGNGYILSFSNNDSTDNAQGNGDATVVATKFVTNSSKELKTDIRPINDIDQAVKDILKIEPKQYLYQSQVDQLSEWEDNGKPADTFKHLDTEINVGLIAEEMDEYDSLRPFIEKVTDEEGNEGILGIDYSKLTPLLLAVCQEQDNKINELEERLVRMELLMKDLHS